MESHTLRGGDNISRHDALGDRPVDVLNPVMALGIVAANATQYKKLGYIAESLGAIRLSIRGRRARIKNVVWRGVAILAVGLALPPCQRRAYVHKQLHVLRRTSHFQNGDVLPAFLEHGSIVKIIPRVLVKLSRR